MAIPLCRHRMLAQQAANGLLQRGWFGQAPADSVLILYSQGEALHGHGAVHLSDDSFDFTHCAHPLSYKLYHKAQRNGII